MTVKELKLALRHVDDDLNVFVLNQLDGVLIDTNSADEVSIFGWKKQWNGGNNHLFQIITGETKLI